MCRVRFILTSKDRNNNVQKIFKIRVNNVQDLKKIPLHYAQNKIN